MNPYDSDDQLKLIEFIDTQCGASAQIGLMLVGSFARGDAKKFSDIDIILISNEPSDLVQKILRYEGRLLIINGVSEASIEEVFTNPLSACRYLRGLRAAIPLTDPFGIIRHLKGRSLSFQWDRTMKKKAARYISSEMVGWLEEVHKGLDGLACKDTGRLLQSIHGCSWGLLRVMQIHLRVLEISDNTVVMDVSRTLGDASEWSKLLKVAIGLDENDLPSRVRAGLHLYLLTADIVRPSLEPNEIGLLEPTLAHLREYLTNFN
ncbi:hypothetical protein PS838_01454 [Pseudomonas fluorescens]|nr:hypothetical protein PS838_01454 [Pseudomonas fluorescens]